MPRREERKKFLDASLVPLENALLARAKIINERGIRIGSGRIGSGYRNSSEANFLLVLSAEFVELAEELHHW